MSVELVKHEILRFLSSNNPEVLSISGEWGVGKTFCWKKYLAEANHVALDRYAYVSLFGVNSLDELKYSIFENTVKIEEASKAADLETFTSMLESAEKLRKYMWVANLVPGLRTYFSAASPAFFLSVRNQIICIDDFERKGEKLESKDILGLVSFLKEQRSCKVVMILNADALSEKQKGEFQKYLEKVVDTSLNFMPSASESVQIALTDGAEINSLIYDCCIALGISNIRIIRKIKKLACAIEPHLKPYNEQVLLGAVKSLALFTWSYSIPDKAPPLEYVQNRNAIREMMSSVAKREKKISQEEAAWNALLDAYGFRYMDDLDKVLLEGVKNGFFDPQALGNAAAQLDEQITTTVSRGSFESAWESFHDSFSNTQEEVINTIHQSFLKNVQYISPMDLNGTVTLFKEVGRSDLAKEIIDYHVEKRADRKLFDLRTHLPITDPDVVNAFKEKFDSFEEAPKPAEILVKMAEGNSWNPDDLATVSNMSVDDYYRIFKMKTGEELKLLISFCLQFDRTLNATSEMKEISKRAREALQLIGKESRINALRVQKYGVD